jgi:hypothetical protein
MLSHVDDFTTIVYLTYSAGAGVFAQKAPGHIGYATYNRSSGLILMEVVSDWVGEDCWGLSEEKICRDGCMDVSGLRN